MVKGTMDFPYRQRKRAPHHRHHGTSSGFGKLSVERSAAGGWNVAATVRKNTDPAAHLSKTRKAGS
jgi:hypothetical protein